MRRPLFTLFAVVGCLAGCSERSIDVGVPLSLTLAQDGGKVVSIANCGVDDDINLDRDCVIGSDARAYTVHGDLPVLPAAPPYAVFLHFKSGYGPDPDDVKAEGSVKAYAAPTNIESRHGIPENSETNRVDVSVSMPDDRGVLATVNHAVSTPMQVSLVLDYMALYRSRPAILEALNPGAVPVSSIGYVARFYVGSVPPNDLPCPQPPEPCMVGGP